MNFEYIWFGHSSTCNYMTMVMQLHGMIFFVKIFEKQRSNVKVAWIQGKRSYYLQKMKQARLQPRTQALTFAHPPPLLRKDPGALWSRGTQNLGA